VPVFRAMGLGVVPGFLVAGILVGPSGLALIDNSDEIRQLAELGVVLLLFVIGIELKPARLWLMRRLVFGLGTLQVAVTGASSSRPTFLTSRSISTRRSCCGNGRTGIPSSMAMAGGPTSCGLPA